MSLVSATLMLTLVMDPLGNLPIFATSLRQVQPGRRARVLWRELAIALAALLAFLVAGESFLSVLHLTPESVRIAGGLVLLLISLRMVFPTAEGIMGATGTGEPFIVPLAIPLIAGPSTLSAVMLLSGDVGTGVGAVLLSWAVVALILSCSFPLERLLGEKGLTALERLMGMLLAMIAVQMLVDGAREVFA